jgi:hypothetical protein
MSEWIKCSERMPDGATAEVLTIMANGQQHIAEYSGTDWYGQNGGRLLDERWPDRSTVTHWMPLPEPPHPDPKGSP